MKKNNGYSSPSIIRMELECFSICADSGSMTDSVDVTDSTEEGWTVEW